MQHLTNKIKFCPINQKMKSHDLVCHLIQSFLNAKGGSDISHHALRLCSQWTCRVIAVCVCMTWEHVRFKSDRINPSVRRGLIVSCWVRADLAQLKWANCLALIKQAHAVHGNYSSYLFDYKAPYEWSLYNINFLNFHSLQLSSNYKEIQYLDRFLHFGVWAVLFCCMRSKEAEKV